MSTPYTESEIIQLAAQAINLKLWEFRGDFYESPVDGRDACSDWNPLKHRDDAFRLMMALGMTVKVLLHLNRTLVEYGNISVAYSHGRDGTAVERATCRAITEVAARVALKLETYMTTEEHIHTLSDTQSA